MNSVASYHVGLLIERHEHANKFHLCVKYDSITGPYMAQW